MRLFRHRLSFANRLPMADLNHRTAVVNAIRAILPFTRGNDLAGATIERVELQIQHLDQNLQGFREVQDRLIGANIPQAEFEVHERLRATIQNEYDEAKIALQIRANELRRANVPVQPVAEPQQQQVIQIEGLNHLLAQKVENTWGEFDGTLWKWLSFRDLYHTAVHEHPHLSPAQKFQHLMKSLKGEAREALGHWKVTVENYVLAYQRLCDLYNQPHRAACELMNRLYELPVLKEASSKGLQHMSNVANEVKRQLTALNYSTQFSDVMFITALQVKLDEDTREKWEDEREENPTLTGMLTFIERRARTLACSNSKTKEHNAHKEQRDNHKRFGDKPNHQTPFKKPFIQSKSEQENRPSTSNPVCAFCNGSHKTRLCNKYLAKDQVGREKMVKEKKSCLNCEIWAHG